MGKIEKFVGDVIQGAAQAQIRFELLAEMSEVTELLETSSDLDFIFLHEDDLLRFTEILRVQLGVHSSIELVSISDFPSGQQWVFRHEGRVFMLDLMRELRFHNFRLLDGRVYFALREAGLDALGIARFVKARTGFKQAWPGVPPEIYSFRVTRPTPLTRMVYFGHKVVESIVSMLSARSGLFVVILGPDGSGKSTVIDRVAETLCGERAVLPVFRFHWRPQLLPVRGAPQVVTDPHAQAPRGSFMSLVKLGYLWLTFNLGYWLRLHRLLHRGCIVLFDRYYHDLLVDPRRYRLRAPFWLTRLVGTALPGPDLWILLDAPPEVLHARKQEVPLAETARQRAAYLELVRQFPEHLVVDAAASPEAVATAVTNALVSAMARRTAARIGSAVS